MTDESWRPGRRCISCSRAQFLFDSKGVC